MKRVKSVKRILYNKVKYNKSGNKVMGKYRLKQRNLPLHNLDAIIALTHREIQKNLRKLSNVASYGLKLTPRKNRRKCKRRRNFFINQRPVTNKTDKRKALFVTADLGCRKFDKRVDLKRYYHHLKLLELNTYLSFWATFCTTFVAFFYHQEIFYLFSMGVLNFAHRYLGDWVHRSSMFIYNNFTEAFWFELAASTFFVVIFNFFFFAYLYIWYNTQMVGRTFTKVWLVLIFFYILVIVTAGSLIYNDLLDAYYSVFFSNTTYGKAQSIDVLQINLQLTLKEYALFVENYTLGYLFLLWLPVFLTVIQVFKVYTIVYVPYTQFRKMLYGAVMLVVIIWTPNYEFLFNFFLLGIIIVLLEFYIYFTILWFVAFHLVTVDVVPTVVTMISSVFPDIEYIDPIPSPILIDVSSLKNELTLPYNNTTYWDNWVIPGFCFYPTGCVLVDDLSYDYSRWKINRQGFIDIMWREYDYFLNLQTAYYEFHQPESLSRPIRYMDPRIEDSMICQGNDSSRLENAINYDDTSFMYLMSDDFLLRHNDTFLRWLKHPRDYNFALDKYWYYGYCLPSEDLYEEIFRDYLYDLLQPYDLWVDLFPRHYVSSIYSDIYGEPMYAEIPIYNDPYQIDIRNEVNKIQVRPYRLPTRDELPYWGE